jgi:hypothetical protein
MMNPNRSTPRYLRRLMVAPACALFAVSSAWAQQVAQPAAEPASSPPATAFKPVPSEPGEETTIRMSPFTVNTTRDAGYFAENTLAGSRLNTNLGDLAASITVVTKLQMVNTASLNINDVFRYEAGTEGSSTYAPFINDGRGVAKDTLAGLTDSGGNSTTNAQSNRVRGLTTPDAAINNFPTNSRLPFDVYNTQSVEITRGPNSLLFGLGTPAGIVNQTASQAVLDRNTGELTLRTDQNGTFRTSLALNCSLIPGKLAVYGAFLYDDEQFERKPSRDLTRREYGAITYKPFKKTTLRAFAENYQNDANRPNFFTPRDWVTPWLQAGRPAYNPITRMVTMLDTGAVMGPYVSNLLSPGYVTGGVLGSASPSSYFLSTTPPNTRVNPLFQPGMIFEDTTRPLRFIDNGTSIAYYQRQPVLYAPAQTNPATAVPTPASLGWVAQDARYAILDRQWSTSALNYPTTVLNRAFPTQVYPVIDGVAYAVYNNPAVTNKAIYDWTKYNHAQTNFSRTRASNYNIEIDQEILPNLFFNAGWLRQHIDDVSNNTMSQLTGATLSIDTKSTLINGTANPYFGLPMIGEGQGGGMDTWYTPETDDNYRAMLTYELDLTKQNKFLKWFGRHRLLGIWSRQDVKKATERWRNGFVDGDADAKLRYVPNFTIGNTSAALNPLTLERKYYMASPGDAQATVTHSAGFWGNQGWNEPFTSQIQVYNYSTGQFQYDTVVEQALFSSAGSFRTQREVKTWTFAVQSYLWDDRLVTTLGWRRDDYRARITTIGAVTDVNGVVTSPVLPNSVIYTNGFTGGLNHDVVMNRWGRWDALTGNTKTLGAAFRPLKGWTDIDRRANEGSFAADFLRGLTFYYNQSDNFNPPATYNTDYFARPLPKPTGKGKDGGIGFSLFDNKLVARINWYDTTTQNERTVAAATLLGRLQYSDTTTGLAWAAAVYRIRHGANTAVPNWNTEAANPVSAVAVQQQLYDLIQLPYNYYTGVATAGTQDSKAKGVELQLTYNPSKNWTIKITADKQRTSYTNVVPQYDAWLAVRLPIWQSLSAPEIANFTDGGGVRYSLSNFWTGYGFTNVALVTNSDGNNSPQGYFNNVVVPQVATAKALEGADATDQRKYHASLLTNYVFTTGKLKGFSVGGAERWESKAGIGYFGKATDPNLPTLINRVDITRPVYDSANFYTDLWVAYSRKIFGDKIGWTLQLNINNVFERGHLIPTATNLDGKPYAYRIIDPRQFVLTSTFTF